MNTNITARAKQANGKTEQRRVVSADDSRIFSDFIQLNLRQLLNYSSLVEPFEGRHTPTGFLDYPLRATEAD
jgi:hypothetical protein